MKESTFSLIAPGLAGEIGLRIEKIRSGMEPDSALLIAGNVNILYSSGRFFRGYVWLPFRGTPLYFVIKPQIFEPAENVVYIRKPEQIPDELSKRGLSVPSAVGLEEDVLSYSDTLRLMKVFPQSEVFNSTPVLRNARMVKTPYEIDCMREDGRKQTAV